MQDLRSIQQQEAQAALASGLSVSASSSVAASGPRTVAQILSGRSAPVGLPMPGVVTAVLPASIKSIRELHAEQGSVAAISTAPIKSYSSTMGGSKTLASQINSSNTKVVGPNVVLESLPAGVAGLVIVDEQASDDMFWSSNAKSVDREHVLETAPKSSTPKKTSHGAVTAAANVGGSASKPSKNAFGGPSLSRDMEVWCKQEMAKLTGNDGMQEYHINI